MTAAKAASRFPSVAPAVTLVGLLLCVSCETTDSQSTGDPLAEMLAANGVRSGQGMARGGDGEARATQGGGAHGDAQIEWTPTTELNRGGVAQARPTPAATQHRSHVPTHLTPQHDETETTVTRPSQQPDAVESQQRVPTPAALSDAELLEEMRRRIAAGDDLSRSAAVRAAALSMLDPSKPFDPQALEGLSDAEREQFLRFHKLMASMAGHLATPGGKVDREAVLARLDEMFGDRPLTIQAIRLCKRVRGYGVYDAFENHTFLAGRTHRMIVYVELDDFAIDRRDNGQYEVKLTQEIILYAKADGSAVWRQPAVEVRDVSHNERRDFFVVQMITLPSRLSVGDYVMKVRVRDQVGQTVDEKTEGLRIVAGGALVSGSER